jgi:hypothetical protein
MEEDDVEGFMEKLNKKCAKKKSKNVKKENGGKSKGRKLFICSDSDSEYDKDEIDNDYYNPKVDESESLYQGRYVNGIDLVQYWLDSKKPKEKMEEGSGMETKTGSELVS